MPLYVFDTNHLTFFEQSRPSLTARFLACQPGAVGVAVVAVQEALKGRLAALATARKPIEYIRGYQFLEVTVGCVARLPILGFDAAAEAFYQTIRLLRLRVGSQDQRIAAIAVAHGCTLLTRNTSDFIGIPGLRLDDWSV